MQVSQALNRLYFLLILLTAVCTGYCQETTGKSDSWQEVFKNKSGTVTALWDDIEPFIYTNKEGKLEGVEYEIMESLKPYLKIKYGIDLTIQWKRAGSFNDIYRQVRDSKTSGLFGWSYYSITPERRKEVQFSLPYMPDLNVLVTNNREPMYAGSQEFISRLKDMQALTQSNTTMEEDVQSLKTSFYPSLPIIKMQHDYEILRAVAADGRFFGYVPLSVYIVALQKGIKVKRQQVLSSRREGFAAVIPIRSDWKPILDEYFSSSMFREKSGSIVSSYLGSEVKDLVFDGASTLTTNRDLNLVSLEKEIVTKRLMDTAIEVERQRFFRNIILVVLAFILILSVLLYSRFRTKQTLNKQLNKTNQQISLQNDQIEQMNQLLKLKILQTRLNPHFLFNSLNSIQYFIAGNDKKASLLYISRFSAFLRKVINFGDELSIDINDEAELLHEYLWLEHCRFPDKFEYEIRVEPGIKKGTSILPLFTHGLVEDALYKGILYLKDNKKGKISIDFNGKAGMLTVTVSDNGESRESTADAEKKKAVKNGEDNMLTRRINLFNGQSKNKISLRQGISATTNGEYLNISVLEIPQPLFTQINT